MTKQLIIDWSDKHQSIYDLKWLQERAFVDGRREKYLNEFYRPKPKHWRGSEFQKIVEILEFKDVMNSDQGKFMRSFNVRSLDFGQTNK